MKLFGHPASGHSFKVKFFLEFAGIEHDYEEVDIFIKHEERQIIFQENSRFEEVPLLVDGDNAYVQSNSILAYLAKKLDNWGAQDIDSLNKCFEWLFWESNKIGLCLPQLRAAQQFSNYPINKGAIEWLIERYKFDVGILNDELADGRNYLLGNHPTIADFSICGYLYFADEANVTVPRHVEKWLITMSQLRGWQHPYELLNSN